MASNLYLVEIEIEYKGTTFGDFLKILLEDVNYYLEEQKAGRAKQLWKSAGERKFFIIIEKSSEEMDTMMFTSPLIKKLGDQVKVKVTELIRYEAFANNMNNLIKQDKIYQVTEPVERTGLYFWGEFNVGYTGHTLEDLLRIWCEEAEAALGAKGTGLVVDLWKCVGMRRVHALFNFDSIEQLDEITSFGLPIVQQNGDNVDLKIKPVRSFCSLAEHLKK